MKPKLRSPCTLRYQRRVHGDRNLGFMGVYGKYVGRALEVHAAAVRSFVEGKPSEAATELDKMSLVEVMENIGSGSVESTLGSRSGLRMARCKLQSRCWDVLLERPAEHVYSLRMVTHVCI
eukprot:NODE_25554_length_583_cov_2.357456.p1 GENE.NODE_25554_length_583_cov_2.357456~~NODE_25554_length_583_cov_2.357456.p1  ORF type:complete len:121 (-),score=12.35 NODE_25554_length_583_cov_2.357456:186-548(-)